MNLKVLILEMKWVILSLIITIVFATFWDSRVSVFDESLGTHRTFLGLSKIWEILVFFVFNTFVVFGIKGFFEMYSRKTANIIMIISGSLLALAIIFLSYQILFKV